MSDSTDRRAPPTTPTWDEPLGIFLPRPLNPTASPLPFAPRSLPGLPQVLTGPQSIEPRVSQEAERRVVAQRFFFGKCCPKTPVRALFPSTSPPSVSPSHPPPSNLPPSPTTP